MFCIYSLIGTRYMKMIIRLKVNRIYMKEKLLKNNAFLLSCNSYLFKNIALFRLQNNQKLQVLFLRADGITDLDV
jgi:hypothetical protein